MKIGVCSANSGPYTTREALLEVADQSEAVGIESIWVSEHLVVADPRQPPSQMNPEDPILDPVATLAFLAGTTRSVLLGTGVVVLPLRNPLILAKELATVDVLSGGRLLFGVGVGYVAAGVRGARCAVRRPRSSNRGVPGGDPRGLDGDAPVLRWPDRDGGRRAGAPASGPASPPADRDGWRRASRDAPDDPGGRRVVRLGSRPRVETARRLEVLRETATHVPRGEGLGPLEITITPPRDIDASEASRYAELGVSRINLMLPWDRPTAAFPGSSPRPSPHSWSCRAPDPNKEVRRGKRGPRRTAESRIARLVAPRSFDVGTQLLPDPPPGHVLVRILALWGVCE